MEFLTGNSGNSLFATVTKVGNECQQEGAYCQYLGEEVCPKIYAIIPNGYVMEMLEPCIHTSDLLLHIENLLEEKVWSRPALPSSVDWDWREGLRSYGIETPDFVIPTEFCLVHGDPTASNTLLRNNNQIILCDPRPPREYIPQCKESDMGRILQSFYGWEVAAYGELYANYVPPRFMLDWDLYRKALFWMGAAAARIENLEKSRKHQRNSVLQWCKEIRRMSNEFVDHYSRGRKKSEIPGSWIQYPETLSSDS